MITVRLHSPIPLHDQLVGGIRALIAAGRLGPGDELPPIRQLAADLGINLNTVARAYRELESDGLVRAARGRGTQITAALERSRTSAGEAHEQVAERLTTALVDAKLAGFSEASARALLDRIVARFWNAGSDPESLVRSGGTTS